MKNILKYVAFTFMALSFLSCEKPGEESLPAEPLPVTPTNINGTWQLTEWKGSELPAGRYFYIEFIRRDNLFKSYENTSTYEVHKETGYYSITLDDFGGSVIRGMLDNSMGQEWNHSYLVTDLYEDSMVWTVVDDPEDVSVFRRVDAIPVEITGEPAE